jgi:rhodanese-related sulfurtransferase
MLDRSFLTRCLLGPLAAVLVIAGCTTKTSDRDLSLVDPVKGQELVEGRRTLLGETRSGVWVDPRSPADFARGHIPGAINVPFESVRTEYRKLLDHQVIVVYGENYGSGLADAMSKTLMQLGFKEVHTLEGGLAAWKDAGRQIE